MSPSANKLNECKTFGFITFLRGIAVLLIAWDHLVGVWLDTNKVTWLPLNLVRQYVAQPLGISQDFGFLGVVLIFLISGFIITHAAQAESRKEFAIKRLFRLYPPLIISIILIVVFYWTYSAVYQTQTYIQAFNYKDILLAGTLANYFMIPQNVVNGIAWILVVEGLFYIACFSILPLLQNKPKTSMAILIGFTGSMLAISRQFGPNFYLFATSVSYIPYLLMGQVLYYRFKRRITILQFGVLSALIVVVSIQGMLVLNSDNTGIISSYGISFVYAFLIFITAILLSERIKIGRFFGFYSKISYSFYLNQGVGLLFISILFPLLGFGFSLGIAFVLLTLLAYLSWRFVEEPSRKIARK